MSVINPISDLIARLELYQKLEEAERQARRGRKMLGHQEVMRKLRARLGCGALPRSLPACRRAYRQASTDTVLP